MDYATQQTLRSFYGSLMDIGEFDLIVSFANPLASDDWTTTTVTLKGCIFSEDGIWERLFCFRHSEISVVVLFYLSFCRA